MEWIATLVDFLFAFGQVAALGFLAYGGWLAGRHGETFASEAKGRFDYRHRRRARAAARKSAGELPLA